jgi:hypothetical protein
LECGGKTPLWGRDMSRPGKRGHAPQSKRNSQTTKRASAVVCKAANNARLFRMDGAIAIPVLLALAAGLI